MVGKTAKVGIKERDSKKIESFQVADTKAITQHQIVCVSVSTGSTVYTDDDTACQGLKEQGCTHESVKHSPGEYVKEQAHINGAESFQAYLKRGFYSVYHKISPKHLQKYVDEFSARQNVHQLDTMVQIDSMNRGLSGKRLRYEELVDGPDGRLH